jgi:myo-inositol-1-phosphate synthase
MLRAEEIKTAKGKLGVLLVGLGAVSTTFVAGVEAIRKGQAEAIGSVSQMATIRLGKRPENRTPLIKDFVPLAKLQDIEFLAWDIFEADAYEAALKAGVLEKSLLDGLEQELRQLRPHRAVFSTDYVKKLDGTHVKKVRPKWIWLNN